MSPAQDAAATIAAAAQLACLLEASAPKPGNVSPGRPFTDIRYEHFLASAAAVGGAFAFAGEQPLGTTIRRAIEATAHWAPSNTNLGIVLLLAPLAKAAAISVPGGSAGWAGRGVDMSESAAALRTAVAKVLASTSVEDAREAYAAIRLANPGGLGRAGDEDVASEPSVTLVDAMRLAADRDGIAREYASGFQVTFESGVSALSRARQSGLAWEDAVVETYLTLLAGSADTHIVRRAGRPAAEETSRRAADTLAAGGVRSEAGRRAILDMDAALRGPRNAANPGTTADLTAAAIFVYLLTGGWHRGHPYPGDGGHDG